jgi:hypothetical protein
MNSPFNPTAQHQFPHSDAVDFTYVLKNIAIGLRILRRNARKLAELARHGPGNKVSSAKNIPVPLLLPSQWRADRFIMDQLRERARVSTCTSQLIYWYFSWKPK